jgi:hypothetical protein
MALRPCQEPSKMPLKPDLDSKATWTNVPPLMRLEKTARRKQCPDGLGEDADQDVSAILYIVPRKPSPGRQPTANASHCPIL